MTATDASDCSQNGSSHHTTCESQDDQPSDDTASNDYSAATSEQAESDQSDCNRDKTVPDLTQRSHPTYDNSSKISPQFTNLTIKDEGSAQDTPTKGGTTVDQTHNDRESAARSNDAAHIPSSDCVHNHSLFRTSHAHRLLSNELRYLGFSYFSTED